jgi:hypothetical protein
MRWSELKNGELLARASSQFDVMLTAAQNLTYQQNLDRLPTAVVVIGKEHRIETLRALVSGLLTALSSIQPRTLIHIGA